jgi:hypothetical protein
MNIQVLIGFNAGKRLNDGTDGGFAPLAIGAYKAKPTGDSYLALKRAVVLLFISVLKC